MAFPVRFSNYFLISLLIITIMTKHITTAAPEDYVEPSPEDEDWEDDEELIIRDDGTVAGERPKLAARPPFTLHDYNETLHAWISPIDEVKTLRAAVESSYQRMCVEFQENHLKVAHLLPFMQYILNPDDQEITEDETAEIERAVTSLKESEAMIDEGAGLYVGYLNKGSPFEMIKSTFVKMRNGRREGGGVGGGQERRQLKTEEKHLDGLYEHEIAVDVPLPLPDGHESRVLLD